MDEKTPVPKKPQKKKATPEKNLIPPSESLLETVELTEENKKFINNIIQSSIKRYQKRVNDELKDYQIDIDGLECRVSEYLDDFLILGYTPDKRRVLVRYAPTPQGYDSLRDLSRQFIMKVMMNNGELPDMF